MPNFRDTLTDESLSHTAVALLQHYFDADSDEYFETRRPYLDMPDLAYDFCECDASDCDDAEFITRADLDFRSLIIADIAIYLIELSIPTEIPD